jgi:hypothetical protein
MTEALASLNATVSWELRFRKTRCAFEIRLFMILRYLTTEPFDPCVDLKATVRTGEGAL